MLNDVLSYELDVVFCGTARGDKSADEGYYYADGRNKFYRALHEAGFTKRLLSFRDCYEVNKYGFGLTDLVHTESGNDSDISDEAYEIEPFKTKMLKYQPRFIAFTSKEGAKRYFDLKSTKQVDYGLHAASIGQSRIFVLTSPSGSAHVYWDIQYWKDLNSLVKSDAK